MAGDSLFVLPTESWLSPSHEQRYRELFEGALLGIYVSRPDGALVASNAEFARMLGSRR